MSGSNASVIGSTRLIKDKGFGAGQFWIQGDKVIGPAFKGRNVTIWKYPAGRGPTKSIKDLGGEASGVTVSIAPNH